jgi:hypothetical protein
MSRTQRTIAVGSGPAVTTGQKAYGSDSEECQSAGLGDGRNPECPRNRVHVLRTAGHLEADRPVAVGRSIEKLEIEGRHLAGDGWCQQLHVRDDVSGTEIESCQDDVIISRCPTIKPAIQGWGVDRDREARGVDVNDVALAISGEVIFDAGSDHDVHTCRVRKAADVHRVADQTGVGKTRHTNAHHPGHAAPYYLRQAPSQRGVSEAFKHERLPGDFEKWLR